MHPAHRASVALHHIIDIPKPDGSREVFALCDVDQYNHLFVADVDNDDKLEMYADITT